MTLLDVEARLLAAVRDAVAATTPADEAAPTPCSDWTVRQLIAHLVAVNIKYADVGQGGPLLPGTPKVDLGDDLSRAYERTIRPFLDAWRAQGALDREGEAGAPDFYSYRYLASEGFLPGYSFPRLPLAAYIPARRGLKVDGDCLQRPRGSSRSASSGPAR